MFVSLNMPWLSMETGEVVWEYVLIFDYIPLPTLAYNSRTKALCSKLRCLFMALCFCMWERRYAALIQLCTKRKKWSAQQHASLLLSLAALTEHQRNKPPADTTVRFAKEETPPIYTFIHLRRVHQGQKLRKRHILAVWLALSNHRVMYISLAPFDQIWAKKEPEACFWFTGFSCGTLMCCTCIYRTLADIYFLEEPGYSV